MEIPALIVNGFLESGKTQFIKELIEDNGFKEDGKTLILLCEEGEEEYDAEFCKRNSCSVRVIEDESEFNEKTIKKFIKEIHPATIVVEMNVMWNENEIVYPKFFAIQQQITIVDATTFPAYFANIRQKFTDMLKYTDVVIINRAVEDTVGGYKRSLKMLAPSASFYMYDENGVDLHPADDLPYDINKDIIEVEDEDFGTWYIETFDSPARYNNRVVKIRGYIVKPNDLPPHTVVIARQAMTCCANDIQLIGHMLSYNDEFPLADGQWIELTAKIHYIQHPQTGEQRCVLEALDIVKINEIKEPVLNLVGA